MKPTKVDPLIKKAIWHTHKISEIIGTADHSSLSNLAWTSSGHSGTASKLAGFDASGLASEYSTDHNDTTNKQGGTTNEYYHLTSAEHTVVGNTSGTNTGDQSASDFNHDDLSNISGGGVGEYNHITDAEYTVLGNTSGTNTGDQQGDGVTITGAGTAGDPFVAVGGGGGEDSIVIDNGDGTATVYTVIAQVVNIEEEKNTIAEQVEEKDKLEKLLDNLSKL